MTASPEIEGIAFKPRVLGFGEKLFLQVVFAVGIVLPILLCSYGLLAYFLGQP